MRAIAGVSCGGGGGFGLRIWNGLSRSFCTPVCGTSRALSLCVSHKDGPPLTREAVTPDEADSIGSNCWGRQHSRAPATEETSPSPELQHSTALFFAFFNPFRVFWEIGMHSYRRAAAPLWWWCRPSKLVCCFD